MNSLYVSKTAPQEVPAGLSNVVKAHDAILSRTRRQILPSGNSQSVGQNATINFNIASNQEWLDCKTAVLHFTLEMAKDGAGEAAVPKTDFTALFRSALLEVKGQSLIENDQQMDVYNGLRSRVFESHVDKQAANQVDCGEWDVVGDNYIYEESRCSSSMVYRVAIPLEKIVDFYGLDRSYIPLFALPQVLRLTTSTLDRAFFTTTATTKPTDYVLSNIRIEADMLMMSDEVNGAFRKLVGDGAVSFFYPAHFTVTESHASNAVSLNAKTNLNASCLNHLLVHIADPAPTAVTDMSPMVTQAGVDDDSMAGINWQVYIDSRPVFSTPIDNLASLYNELKKVSFNENDRSRTEAPAIGAQGWLEAGGVTYAAGRPYRNYNQAVFPANFKREITPESVSGVNTSLTGGNIAVQLNVPTAIAKARQACLFFQMTRELQLSASFISVIR